MSKPQYAILRFAKYKGPEIGGIEAHNERTKEKYAIGGGPCDSYAGVLLGKKEIRDQSLFSRGTDVYPTTSRPQNDFFRSGAYGRENAPYAPFFVCRAWHQSCW